MRAKSLKKVECNLYLKRLPRISLICKLVPVRYWDYEYCLLEATGRWLWFHTSHGLHGEGGVSFAK